MVSQEDVSLFTRQNPVCVHLDVPICGRYQPEHLLSVEDVIPNRRTAEVNVEVCVASGHAHQAVPRTEKYT